ncbi:unnamed protein product [Brassica rapa subsp. trilocularis]
MRWGVMKKKKKIVVKSVQWGNVLPVMSYSLYLRCLPSTLPC